MTITRTIEIEPTVKELAECFAHLNDEDQAQFFVEVDAVMESWGSYKRGMQISFIAGHLATCNCVTQGAKDFIRDIAECVVLAEKEKTGTSLVIKLGEEKI